MLGIPDKLFQRASALGFECSSDQQQHLIRPGNALEPWHLTYHKGHWVLIVNGTPQIHFNYSEVMKFLDRFDGSHPIPLLEHVTTR
ncbi:MAG: hypothetical protein HC929_09585 [Leptolyngbyaceae cyanobacterium SM2_5_2]|nr:hypothetical protein [Leptolyngbyaceae cyanobacterium SM2_5_2]